MTDLRKKLESSLTEISGVELALWKDTTLQVMYYNGREIAHFHDIPELDIRIPKKFAKRHRLGEPHLSPNHPKRSKNSIWRSLPYNNQSDVEQIIQLTKSLLSEEYSN